MKKNKQKKNNNPIRRKLKLIIEQIIKQNIHKFNLYIHIIFMSEDFRIMMIEMLY